MSTIIRTLDFLSFSLKIVLVEKSSTSTNTILQRACTYISFSPVKLLYLDTLRSCNQSICYPLFFGSKLNNIALMATMTVDTDIRIAPNAGLNVIPIGAKIPAARGIAIKL